MTKAATAAVLGIAVVVAVATSCAPEGQDGGIARPTMAASPMPSPVPVANPPSAGRLRPAAAGGVGIIAEAKRAQAVVAGIVSKVESLDVQGWRGALRVDTALGGDVRLGDTVTIAWEELSKARQVRFEDGQRVLVVLDALPTQSLWRKRFPVGAESGPVLVVASGGEAFLRQPDGLTLFALQHYLVMSPAARDGTPGVQRLAEIVAGGHPAVASEALTLLEAYPADVDPGAEGTAALLSAARNAGREPTLRVAALRFAAGRRLPGTRETALALTEPASPIRAEAYRVLAVLPDGLSPDRVEGLLTDADPAVRAVGVEVDREQAPRERLVTFLRDDPAPIVRLAAGRALLARRGSGDAADTRAIADVIGMLDDSDASVRNGMAESLGALGAVAVGPLAAVVDDGSERAALAAVLGLARTGPQGGVMLASIAESHDNEAVRSFARLAIGDELGHTH